MNKMLVVYNICGISKKEPLNNYIDHIDRILNQKFDNFHIVLSCCLSSDTIKNMLKNLYKDKVSFCFIEENQTVNITFNHSVQKCINTFGPYESYLYVASDVRFTEEYILQKLYNTFKSDNYGIVTGQVDLDSGFEQWLDFSPQINIPYIIPIGRACNMHCFLFSEKFRLAFNNNIIPTIMQAYASESVFSFLCAATNTKWVICRDFILNHLKSFDGASSGQDHKCGQQYYWDNPWKNANLLREVLFTPEADECGIGFEEINNVKLHNSDCYNIDGSCKNPEKLREFINKHFFLPLDNLDYSQIQGTFIP